MRQRSSGLVRLAHRVPILAAVLIAACGEAPHQSRAAPATPAVSAPEPLPETRDQLLARFESLSARARLRWLQDVEAAGAVGMPGARPPMLSVTKASGGRLEIRNLLDKTVCVSVARIRMQGTAVLRCPLDNINACRDILPGATRTIYQRQGETQPACSSSQLEFRVGTPMSPEPSWWSRSALDTFDATRVPRDVGYRDYPIDRLRGELAILEAALAETDRAARWRRELAPR